MMRIDRMGDGLEAEKVLCLWAEEQKYITAMRRAYELITGVLLNDACVPRPLGKGIVDKLLRQ